MKKILLAVLTLVMALGLSACQTAQVDEKVLDSYLNDLKSGNFEASQGKLETVPENFKYGDNEIMKTFFSKMSYEVKSVKADKEGAVATVVIDLPDTTVIYDAMMDSIGDEVQKLQAGNDASKSKATELMVAFMLEKINDPGAVRAVNTVEVTLKAVDGKTAIVPSEALSKALSGIASAN